MSQGIAGARRCASEGSCHDNRPEAFFVTGSLASVLTLVKTNHHVLRSCRQQPVLLLAIDETFGGNFLFSFFFFFLVTISSQKSLRFSHTPFSFSLKKDIKSLGLCIFCHESRGLNIVLAAVLHRGCCSLGSDSPQLLGHLCWRWARFLVVCTGIQIQSLALFGGL